MAIGTRLKTQAHSNAVSRERNDRVKTIMTKHMRMLPLARYRKKRATEKTSDKPSPKPKNLVARKSRMLPLAKHRFELPTRSRNSDKEKSIDVICEEKPPVKNDSG